jgi:hypothetical protein
VSLSHWKARSSDGPYLDGARRWGGRIGKVKIQVKILERAGSNQKRQD